MINLTLRDKIKKLVFSQVRCKITHSNLSINWADILKGIGILITLAVPTILMHFFICEADFRRPLTYVYFILIVWTSFNFPFITGIIVASISSIIVIRYCISGLGTEILDVIPRVILFFLAVIIINWSKTSLKNLENQVKENKRLEEQTNQAEKFAILGKVAAGITHEIRNPLTVIKGFLQLLKTKLDKENDFEKSFSLIFKELNRIEKIIHDFLLFSKLTEPEKEAADINTVVEECLQFLESEFILYNISLTTELKADLSKIFIDINQIMQVLLNILSNAVQSMNNKGKIFISTYQEADFIIVKIKDNGMGIPQETIKKIFNPFFTTKNKGTGLGLSTSLNIVKNHGGTIEVESKPNEETTFYIKLPINGSKNN